MTRPDTSPVSELEQLASTVRLSVKITLGAETEWRRDEAIDEISRKLTPEGMAPDEAAAIRNNVVLEIDRMVANQDIELRNGMLVKISR